MNTNQLPCDDGDLAHLAPCSAPDALRREPPSIEVDDESQLTLSPLRRSHHRYFARVRLERFADLQVLGLVPRRIKEQAVREAVASDDTQALRLAGDRVHHGAADAVPRCGCGTPSGPAQTAVLAAASVSGQGALPALASAAVPFAQALDAAYREIRRDYHPALARVLSEHLGVDLAWNSPQAASVKGWVTQVSRASLALVGLFEDITIGRKARLEVDAASRSLLARSIRIHREGQLIHRGAYLRIWASSIESFLDRPLAATVHTPLWALDR